MKHEVEIERIYKGTVYFYPANVEHTDKINNKSFEIAHQFPNVECEFNQGGPAWDPYTIYTSESEEAVKQAVAKLTAYIKRFK